jgi:maltooligosyltrehalose synthase
VPDVYQGCEGWNFSLVDPDNRRPVDFAAAGQRLQQLQHDFPDGAGSDGLTQMLHTLSDGRLKHYLLWRGLELRRTLQATLRDGRYLPLDVRGPAARHVVAFARVDEHGAVVAIATRLLFGLTEGDEARICDAATWAGTRVSLPRRHAAGGWREALSGRHLPQWAEEAAGLELSEVFGPLPLALLVAEGGGAA